MYQNQLINAVVLWEKRLEIEEAQRKTRVYRSRPEVDSLTTSSMVDGFAVGMGEKSFSGRVSIARGLKSQAENLSSCCMSDPCQKSQLS